MSFRYSDGDPAFQSSFNMSCILLLPSAAVVLLPALDEGDRRMHRVLLVLPSVAGARYVIQCDALLHSIR